MDALIRADKDVDLLFLPGAGHGAGGAYGTRKRNDYFVRHLLGVDPPHWNAGAEATSSDLGTAPGSGIDDWLDLPSSELTYPSGEWG